MKESTEFVKEKITEWIDEETGEYVKHKVKEDGRYKFYLRFISKHFTPCGDCQKELNDLIYTANSLCLGNKSYEPAIELSRQWNIDEDSWKELERREPTEADFRRMYGLNWEGHYKGWKEAFKK